MATSLSYSNPILAKEWHPSRNGDLTPDDVSSGSHKKVWWLGSCGHEWEAQVKSRNQGRGCPFCSSRLLLSGFNDLASKHPEILEEWDYSKNADVSPSEILPGSHTKVWWKCSKGHVWQASPNHRISKGRSCPFCCHNPQVLSGVNDLQTIHPELIEEWDFERNSVLPSELTSGSNIQVWWHCKKGHEWKTSVNHRVDGSTCPFCARGAQTSFPEQAIFFYVKKAYPDAINKHRGIFPKKSMELDVFIPTLNTGIEYDGAAYHKNDRQIRNDIEKSQFCQDFGIRLIRVKENMGTSATSTDIIISAEDGLESAIKLLSAHLPLIEDIDIERDSDTIRENYLSDLQSNSLASLNPVLCSEWNYNRNITTPDMYLPNSNSKVWWKCSEGHEWKASIDSRNKGRKCPFCSNRKVLPGYNDLRTKRPDLMIEWHQTKNHDLDPSMILPGSGKKAWWICEKGHEWCAEISSRNKGHGCPICSKTKQVGKEK